MDGVWDREVAARGNARRGLIEDVYRQIERSPYAHMFGLDRNSHDIKIEPLTTDEPGIYETDGKWARNYIRPPRQTATLISRKAALDLSDGAFVGLALHKAGSAMLYCTLSVFKDAVDKVRALSPNENDRRQIRMTLRAFPESRDQVLCMFAEIANIEYPNKGDVVRNCYSDLLTTLNDENPEMARELKGMLDFGGQIDP